MEQKLKSKTRHLFCPLSVHIEFNMLLRAQGWLQVKWRLCYNWYSELLRGSKGEMECFLLLFFVEILLKTFNGMQTRDHLQGLELD